MIAARSAGAHFCRKCSVRIGYGRLFESTRERTEREARHTTAAALVACANGGIHLAGGRPPDPVAS
jgi:hypothetical protein